MRQMRMAAAAALWALPMWAQAAELDGAALGMGWAVPFVGLLVSIAVMPLWQSDCRLVTGFLAAVAG